MSTLKICLTGPQEELVFQNRITFIENKYFLWCCYWRTECWHQRSVLLDRRRICFDVRYAIHLPKKIPPMHCIYKMMLTLKWLQLLFIWAPIGKKGAPIRRIEQLSVKALWRSTHFTFMEDKNLLWWWVGAPLKAAKKQVLHLTMWIGIWPIQLQKIAQEYLQKRQFGWDNRVQLWQTSWQATLCVGQAKVVCQEL